MFLDWQYSFARLRKSLMEYAAHSSCVSLVLLVDGKENRCSHVGPSDVKLKGKYNASPPAEAELRVTIDGHLNARKVFLPNGIKAEEPRVEYV